MPKGTPAPLPMSDEMRKQVSAAIHKLNVTYRQKARALRKEYEQERDRLEDMLQCPVVPRTNL